MLALRKPRAKNGRKDRRFRGLQLQPLEERALLAVDSRFYDGLLTVTSDADDKIAIGSLGGDVRINDADPFAGRVAASDVQAMYIVGGPDTRAIDVSGFREAFTSIEQIVFVGPRWVDPAKVEAISDEILGPGWAKRLSIPDAREFLLSGDWRQPLADGRLAQQLTDAGWGSAQTLLDRIVHESGRRAVVDSVSFASASELSFDVLFNGRLQKSRDTTSTVGIAPQAGSDGTLDASSRLENEPTTALLGLGSEDPVVDIGDATVTEPATSSDTTNIVFYVSVSDDHSGVSFNWTTVDGSAVSPDDFTAASGFVSLSSGTLSTLVTVVVKGDALLEGTETFSVLLSNILGADAGDTTGLGTILDEDVITTQINISDASLAEPDNPGDTASMVFTVSLTETVSGPVTFNWATADGQAVSPDDYVAVPLTGPVTIQPGNLSTTVSVTIKGDAIDELDEDFQVNLSNVTGALEGDLQANGTITDTDPVPIVNLSNATVAEQDGTVLVTVSLSHPSSQIITVDWQTADIVAQHVAVGQGDYDAANGTVSFSAGDVSETVAVTIREDTIPEIDEWFFVGLDNASANAQIGAGQATVTIVDNDPSTITVDDQSINVPENSPNGTSFGPISWLDDLAPDVGPLEFTVIPGGTGDALFAIDFATGEITVTDGSALDFEGATTSYTLNVSVDAAGAVGDTATITINITPVNEAPEFINEPFGPYLPQENVSIIVGFAQAIDPDANDNASWQFSILSGNDEGFFAIVTGVGGGLITSNPPLNYELGSTYVLEIEVRDAAGLSDTTFVTVNVQDQAEAPEITDQTFSIAENVPRHSVVGTVEGRVDEGETPSFTITSVGGPFDIDEHTGRITVADAEALDFENVEAYGLTVELSDGTSAVEVNVLINIDDVNDAPVISDQSFDVDEDADFNDLLWTVTATDQDLPANALQFEFTAGNDEGIFAIRPNGLGTGEIVVARPELLDFENVDQYVLWVQVTDDGEGTLSSTAKMTINVQPRNEPPSIGPQGFTIDSTFGSGTYIGSVSATDPDTGDTLTFSAPPADPNFDVSPAGDITLKQNVSAAVYTLDVTVKDSVLNERSAPMTIDVLAASGSVPSTLTLTGIFRDFHDDPLLFPIHPDFGHPAGEVTVGGLVFHDLGADGKPVLTANHPTVVSPATFADWYSDVPDVNQRVTLPLEFKRKGQGGNNINLEFVDNGFWALDTLGFGKEGALSHNFNFTLELHGGFKYRPGHNQGFKLTKSSDDLWIFINGKLLYDMANQSGTGTQSTLMLDDYTGPDDLNLVDGTVYPLDIFFAKRTMKNQAQFVVQALALPELKPDPPDLLLVEETRFLTNNPNEPVNHPVSFVVPDNPQAISFSYQGLTFDTDDPASINDAFELALIDDLGQSLVPTIGLGRDAFFNITEGVNLGAPVLAAGASLSGPSTIVLDISHLKPGIQAHLVARLVNNDGVDNGFDDTATQVYIAENVEFVSLDAGGPFAESDGLLVVEAENYTGSASGTGIAAQSGWNEIPDAGASSGSSMQALSLNSGIDVGDTTNGARLDYDIDFTNAGVYYVWVRMKGTPGDGSVHVGLDGNLASTGGGLVDESGSWHWKELHDTPPVRVTVDVTTPGVHTLNLWMREDGAAVDKILMTKDMGFNPAVPDPLGPQESPRQHFAAPFSSPPKSTWGPIDFTRLRDVSVGYDVDYQRTSLNEATDVLYVAANLTNNGRFRLRTDQDPILVGVTNFSRPFVSLHDPDGYTPDGMAFYEVTSLATGLDVDQRHDSGETIDGIELRFSNPTGVQFSYDLVVLGAVNHAPAFQTDPVTEVQVDNPAGYYYDSHATDPDNDVLIYALAAGPKGMIVNNQTGEVTWSPQPADVGFTHQVILSATDPDGLFDEQIYTIKVVDMPNRPPLFTSIPVVDAYAGVEYSYPAEAFDPDGDDLTFTPGATVPPGNFNFTLAGLATWTPTVADVNNIYPVELIVTDEHGATDTQNYNIKVHPDPNNRPPVIISEPRTRFEFTEVVNPPSGDVQPSGFFLNLDDGDQHPDQVTITLAGSTQLKVDVFLLFDDTGSFSGYVPGLVDEFPDVITTLTQTFGALDFGFGVGRFEDYGGLDRPFILNQPIISTGTPGFDLAIAAALNRTALGDGLDWEETYLEGLYQAATGLGFDGNDNGNTTDNGAAGSLLAQTAVTLNGDVPAFSSFLTTGLEDNILPPEGSLGGVGFRDGALPIILVATDAPTKYQDDLLTEVTGIDPFTNDTVTVPMSELAEGGVPFTPGGRGATFQQTIDALNALGALVIGMGTYTAPRLSFEGLAKLTGAINRSDVSIDGGTTDAIDPGDPFYFRINPDVPSNVAAGIKSAVTSAILSQAIDITVQASDPTFANITGVRENVDLGDSASFDVLFTGDGNAHSFDLQFLNVDTNLLLGSIPVTINYNYEYDVDAIDPDGDTVTYELLEFPDWASMPDSLTGIIQGNPNEADTYHFKIKASDGRGGEDIQEFDLVVSMGEPNEDPHIDSIAPTQATAGLTYYYDVHATDPDQDNLKYLLTGSPPPAMSIDRDTGIITWTPTRNDVGTDPTITVRVEDGRGGSDQQSFSIEVLASEPINHPPEFDSVPLKMAVAGETYIYTAHAVDPDANKLEYAVVSGPGGLAIDKETGVVVWSPRESDVGTYTVVLRAYDGHDYDLQGYQLTVVSLNEPPVITSVPVTEAGINGGYTYRVIADDPNGDPLKYYVDPVSKFFGMVMGEDSGILSWDFAGGMLPGKYRITVTVADGRGGFDDQTFILTVAQNSPPSIDSDPVTGVLLGDTYSYLVEYSDPDIPDPGDMVTLSIDALSKSRGMQFQGDTLVWTPSLAGDFPVEVTAQDLIGNKFIQRYKIRVFDPAAPNEPPVITSVPKGPAVAGREYQYTLTAEDPNGDPVTLSLFDASMLVPPPSFDPQTGLFTWTPAAGGVYEFTFKAEDDKTAFTTQTVTLTVLDNAPPVITSWPTGTITLGVLFPFAFTAIDPNNDPFTFSLEHAEVGMNITPGGQFTWTPTQVGTYSFDVVATDDPGGRGVQPVELRVIEDPADPNNQPPIVQSEILDVIQAGTTFTYQIKATDPDGDPLTYELLLSPTPPEGVTVDNFGLVQWPTTVDDINDPSNPYVFQVEISDNRVGGTVVGTFTLHVTLDAPPNHPAQIDSQPPAGAVVDERYEHDFKGSDPDDDTIYWSLGKAPAGADINPDSGLLRWTPTIDQLGDQTIEVRVVDVHGEGEVRVFPVTVRSVNLPPKFDVVPSTDLHEGELFSFKIEASDPEGDPLEFTFPDGLPGGMTYEPTTNTLSWTPNSDDVLNSPHMLKVVVETPDGQSDTLEVTLEVTTAVPNHPPEFIPPFAPRYAEVGVEWSYTINASDPESDTLLYILEPSDPVPPAGMSIVGNVVTWTPGPGDVNQVRNFRVSIQEEFTVEQYKLTWPLSVLVLPENNAPVINLPDPINHPLGTEFVLDLSKYAYDPDFQPVTYQLTETGGGSLPAGLSIDGAGLITWPADQVTEGSVNLTVTVTDPLQESATAMTTLVVAVDDTPPIVGVMASASQVFQYTDVTFFVQATDNVAVSSVVLKVLPPGETDPMNADVYPIGPAGQQTLNLDTLLTYEVWAEATDTSNLTTESDHIFVNVVDPLNLPPDVSIFSPTLDMVVSEPVDVVGTISDPEGNPITYTVTLWPADATSPSEAIDLGTFSGARTGEPLGAVIDPTFLANGSYWLRVEARDNASPGLGKDERPIVIDSKLKLGNFALSFTDLEIPFAGFPLTVTRSYDTLRANQPGEFGLGWELDVPNTSVEVPSGDPLEPFLANDLVIITLPDGSTESFRFLPQSNPNPFIGPSDHDLHVVEFYAADFETTSTLTLATGDGQPRELVQYISLGDPYYYRPGSASYRDRYSPARFGDDYLLTTRTGVQLLIDSQTGDLLKITDINGNSVSFTGNGITSDTGVGITFDYESGPGSGRRIRAVYGPEGPTGPSIQYGYNGLGELISVTNRAGEITQFKYEEPTRAHYLTEIIDPRGVSILNVQFDPATGRVISLTDAAGQSAGLGYNLDLGDGRFVESVTDANGAPTEFVRDSRGNTLRQIQHLLVDSATDRYTYLITIFDYDEAGNQTHRSVPFTHDDPATRFDFVPLDLQWAQTTGYDASGNVTSITDALENQTLFLNYDDFGHPGEIIDPLGNKTTNVYDDKGNLLNTTDAEGTFTEYFYNSDRPGFLERVEVDGVEVSSYNYDGKGRVTTTTDAAGFTQSFDYNDYNEITGSSYLWVDPDNAANTKYVKTFTDRDEEGRVIGTRQEVDSVELWTTATVYTNGLVSSTTDRFGVVTENIYDVRGNLIETRTQSKDESGADTWIVSRTVYDEDGRVIYTVDPYADPDPDDTTDFAAPGAHTIYDSLGQVVKTERQSMLTITLQDDPLNPGFKYTPVPIDGNVRSTSETFFDSAGRVDYTREFDGTQALISKNVYDAVGRLDQSIQDLDDNLATTADQLATRYFYDAAGRQTRVIDALGNETRFEYDDVGRQTATISPLVADPNPATPDFVYVRSESVYNAQGRQIQTIENLKQTTFDEDATIITDDARTTDYEYLDGQLTAVILPAVLDSEPGSATEGLMVRPRYEYAYDMYGNQRTIQDPKGRETKFTYDEFNRQTSRQLPDGLTETQHYNDLGQLVLSVDFEDRHTVFNYDPDINRLLSEDFYTDSTSYAGGVPEQTVSYTTDALGRVTVVNDDLTGRTTTHSYDAFGRVIEIAAPEGTVHREYDNVGRVTRTYTGDFDADGTNLAGDNQEITDTRYTYDVLGRLETVTVVERNDIPLGAGEEQTTYTYDAVGNLDTVSLPNGVVSDYDYDALNRLTSLTYALGATPLASYTYELLTDGKRKSATETDSTGVGTFDWVYDDLGRLVKETYTLDGDPTNDFSAEYFFDLASNRVRKEVDLGNDAAVDEVISYLYDDNDRLLSEALDSNNDAIVDQTTVYRYGDSNDRTEQTKKTVWQGDDTGPSGTKLSETTFEYNLQGRLTTVDNDVDADGLVDSRSTYEYDDSGIRVSQKVEKSTADDGNFDEVTETNYVIDSRNHTGYPQVLEERNALTGIVAKTFTLGLDVIAQQAPGVQSGDPLFLLYDGHGSTRMLVDPTGQPLTTEIYRYDAYGNPIGFDPATALTSLLYSGEQTDVTGLQYLRARYYDLATGRFNRLDPFAGNIQDPLSLHKYLYTHGDPVMGVDPSGMFEGLVGTVASIGIRIGALSISGAGLFGLAGQNPIQGAVAGAQLGVGFLIAIDKGKALFGGFMTAAAEVLFQIFSTTNVPINQLSNVDLQWGVLATEAFSAFSDGVFDSAIDFRANLVPGIGPHILAFSTLVSKMVRAALDTHFSNESEEEKRDNLTDLMSLVIDTTLTIATSETFGLPKAAQKRIAKLVKIPIFEEFILSPTDKIATESSKKFAEAVTDYLFPVFNRFLSGLPSLFS